VCLGLPRRMRHHAARAAARSARAARAAARSAHAARAAARSAHAARAAARSARAAARATRARPRTRGHRNKHVRQPRSHAH